MNICKCIIVLLAVCACNICYGQKGHSIYTDIGVGHFSGKGLGYSLNYNYNFADRFLLNLGFVNSNNSYTGRPFLNEEDIVRLEDLQVKGDGPLSAVSKYNSFLLGLGFDLIRKNNQEITLEAGLERSQFEQIRVDGFVITNDMISLLPPKFVNVTDFGTYLRLRYTFNVSDNFGVGGYAAMHSYDDSFYSYGASLVYRF